MAQTSNPHFKRAPSPWVARHAALIAAGGRVLDVAAGHGRQAIFLAAQGLRVVAVDRDAAALATFTAQPNIDARTLDLEGPTWPLSGEHFDGIVCVHYLNRPHFGALLDNLAPDGAFIYETFAAGNEAFGRPSNPAFLLDDGELLQRVHQRLHVVAFEQGRLEQYGTSAVIQRIAAVGTGRAWPPLLAAG